MVHVNALTDVDIVTALAEGYDPFSGEVFDNNHALNHPGIIRALYHAADALGSRANVPPMAGKPWTRSEEELLISEYHKRQSLAEIANNHQRSKGSITARLVHLGLVENREDARKALMATQPEEQESRTTL